MSMFRPNVFSRRLVALAYRHGAPRHASLAACASMAADAAIVSSRRLPSPPPAALTARRASSSDAATELGSILQREIEEEESTAAARGGGLPEELAALDAEIRTRWTVVEGISGVGQAAGETGGGATVRMFRKEPGSKGAKVGIVFHCQDTESDDRFDEEEFLAEHGGVAAPRGEDSEEGEEASQAVRFGVTVSKGGKTVVLECWCNSEGTVDVEGVTVRDGDAEGVLAALAGKENMHAALYQVSRLVSRRPSVRRDAANVCASRLAGARFHGARRGSPGVLSELHRRGMRHRRRRRRVHRHVHRLPRAGGVRLLDENSHRHPGLNKKPNCSTLQ